MAVYWLDLVRYADTVGYHGDQPHNISPYRDWVITAFNDNMPYDQFTREQLAGDLLPGSSVQQKWRPGTIGFCKPPTREDYSSRNMMPFMPPTGYAMFPKSGWVQPYWTVHNVTTISMTPTPSKTIIPSLPFLPILPIVDFNGNKLPTERPPEIQIHTDENSEKLELLSKQIDQTLSVEKQSELKNLRGSKRKAIPVSEKAKDANKTQWQEKINRINQQIAQVAKPAVLQKYRKLVREKKGVEDKGRWTMVSQAVKPRVMRVLPRGNWMDDSGPIVLPAVPEFLGEIDSDKKRLDRLDLANWLTDTEKGIGLLNARVLANRIWYLLFGKGLAPDLTDFGGQGTPPDHPELLDNLAITLVEKTGTSKRSSRIFFSAGPTAKASLPPKAIKASSLPEDYLLNLCGIILWRSADYWWIKLEGPV